MSYYTFFKSALFRPLVRVLVRPRVVGTERVPLDGGALLAGNHVSGWDPIVIPAMLPRQMTFPAKAELFAADGGPLSRVVGWFVKAVGILPLDRAGGRASASSMDVVLEALREGKVVGIFPEGTRSPDGRLYRGRTGVARLALATGVPVIPVGVQHTRPSWRRAVVRFGEPIDFSAYAGAGNDRAVLRHVTDEVMAAIQDLSGQRYVETYANGVKAALREGRSVDVVEVARPGLGRSAPPVPGRS